MREILEALREGGPRNREGGGARWWADEGLRDDIVGSDDSHWEGEPPYNFKCSKTAPFVHFKPDWDYKIAKCLVNAGAL